MAPGIRRVGVIPTRDSGRMSHDGSHLGTGELSHFTEKQREMRWESQKRRAWYGWVRVAFNWQRIVEGFLETAVKVIIASIYLFWMLFYGRCFHSHSFIYSGVTALWDRKQYSDFVCGEPGVESWKLFELLQRGSSRRRPDDMCLVIIPRGSHLR